MSYLEWLALALTVVSGIGIPVAFSFGRAIGREERGKR